MKNLFDKPVYDEIIGRMGTLRLQSQRKWGKMDVAQMLAHCIEAFRVPLSDKPMRRMLIGRLLGWAIKTKLYSDDPWKQNLPTSSQFIIKGSRDFEREKKELVSMIDDFYTRGPQNAGKFAHPMFGKFTKEQWGMAMYKHLNHHLAQFGA
jgi:hypothetical protein